jgi:predicted DNA-binding transcriptional regulator YafY
MDDISVVAPKVRWGLGKRLEFIEFRAFWQGAVNRSDLSSEFGISVPQASADIGAYQKLAPGNLVYDSSKKRYVSAPGFAPRLIVPSAEQYLAQLSSIEQTDAAVARDGLFRFPPIDAMPVPARNVKPLVLRSMLGAIHDGMSQEILYQSMSPKSPEPRWRRITPHSLASDGTRWHVRAYCHTDLKFKDFLLSRCQDVRGNAPPGAAPEMDVHWNERFEVVLEPNPLLSPSQQEAIAQDYLMSDGRLILSMRRALLFYLNKHLRLDLVRHDPRPANNPLVVKNRQRFDEAMQLASF